MSFEARVTRQVTDDELARRRELGPPARTWRGKLWVASSALAAIVLMGASRYTFLIGLLIALGIVLAFAMPSITRREARRKRSWAHLAAAQEHGVGSDGIWLRTAHVELRSSWANLATWERVDGQLCLRCHGMPPVLVPEDALAEAGCLDEVLRLVCYWGGARA